MDFPCAYFDLFFSLALMDYLDDLLYMGDPLVQNAPHGLFLCLYQTDIRLAVLLAFMVYFNDASGTVIQY